MKYDQLRNQGGIVGYEHLSASCFDLVAFRSVSITKIATPDFDLFG
jgi:hypothetical protein